jgi:hypothetical protein
MLDRIVVDVIDMTRQIRLISNGVLPEPSLPEHVLAPMVARDRKSSANHLSREQALDPAPSSGKIPVVFRQREDRVQMIRKNYDGVDREWSFLPCDTESMTEAMFSTRTEERRSAIVTVKKNVPPGTRARR